MLDDGFDQDEAVGLRDSIVHRLRRTGFPNMCNIGLENMCGTMSVTPSLNCRGTYMQEFSLVTERGRFGVLRFALSLSAIILLFACEFGSTDIRSVSNKPPPAFSGPDIVVDEGSKHLLAGGGFDPESGPISYSWVQLSGPIVVFSSITDPNAAVDIPRLPAGEDQDAVLRITVSDSADATSSDILILSIRSLYAENFAKVNDCETIATLPSDILNDEIGPSPRADRTAEILALETSGKFTAPDALYERITAELTGITTTLADFNRYRLPEIRYER